MNKNVVGWFEIPVKDMERAKKFYSSVFQLELTEFPMPGIRMAMFPFSHELPGSPGSLVQGVNFEPSEKGTIIYFSSEDVSHELGRVEAAGGKILLPKTSIGEYGFIGHIIDTEGNKIGLHSRK